MMDMEMNAELERDGGSETGEASTEGSSAGSAYCTLEQDFAKITSEMKGNEALAAYEAEYTRLFESLYRAQRLEEELTEKCGLLKDETEERASKMLELQQKIEADALSEQRLREEILQARKLADSAHAREQKAQEVIEKLRVSIGKLTEEINQKNRQLASDEHTAKASSKSQQQKDDSKERERLVNEIETLKQRMKKLSKTNGEQQQRLSEAEQRLSELQETSERQAQELASERRQRDKCEAELQNGQQQLSLRIGELQAAEERAEASSNEAARQQALLREQLQQNDEQQKEVQKLILKQMSMRMEAERLVAKSEQARKELQEKARNVQDMSREIERLKEDLSKSRADKEAAAKRLMKERTVASRAEDGLKSAAGKLRSAELEIASLSRHVQQDKKAAEKLSRERDAAIKNAQGLEDSNKRLSLEIRVLEQSNRKLQLSIEDMAEAAAELQRQIKALEKERDRGALENLELGQKLEDYLDELKSKRLELGEYQRRVAEAEARFRQQQSLFEEVRAERNSVKKTLSLAHDDLGQCKAKLKSLGQQIDQMREQLSQKEAALLKQEFLFGKTEKEKEALRAELAQGRKSLAELHAQIHEQRQQEKKLRADLQQADARASRQAKEIEAVMSERDIVGSQLVRRNDEMALQSNRLQILQEGLRRGEREYARRLDELRALRLEVRRLRRQKRLLQRRAAGRAALRAELFHLERDLASERLKVTALEDDLQNPLNVHRWRCLEASDPPSFDLLRKMHLLQRRVLALSARLLAKDKALAETEKLYLGLRQMIAKQPGPELLLRLNGARRALRARGNKIKCLVAELNMSVQADHKFEIERMRRELNNVKAKCMARRKPKQLENAKHNCPPPAPALQSGKFYGGGYNLIPSSAKAI